METEGLFEYKLVHIVNFKCVLCNKKYSTETTVKKHLKKNHDIDSPTQAHYVSFVGSKRTKVKVNPTSLSQAEQPSSNSYTASNKTQLVLAFKCAMCDKVFRSNCGISSHLITSHDVPSGLVSAGYSVIQIPKTVTSSTPTFIPPTKKATEMKKNPAETIETMTPLY